MKKVMLGKYGKCSCCGKGVTEGEQLFTIKIPSAEKSKQATAEICLKCMLDLKQDITETGSQYINRQHEEIKQIFNKFQKLKEAWEECAELVNSALSVEINDFICGEGEEEYPFAKSFDEINVYGWVTGIENKCFDAIKELKKAEERLGSR